MLLLSEGTALHSAAEGGHVDVAKVLIQNGVDVSVLLKTNRHFTSVKGLVAKVGQNVTMLDEYKDTHFISSSFRSSICKYVTFNFGRNGADKNRQ